MKLLYVYQRRSRFTDIDLDVLRGAYAVTELPGRPPRALVAAMRADVVVIWFAGWHALLPTIGARLARRPVVVITGGYDVANIPEAGYGMQQGGVRKLVSSWILRRATRLMANPGVGGIAVGSSADAPGEPAIMLYVNGNVLRGSVPVRPLNVGPLCG